MRSASDPGTPPGTLLPELAVVPGHMLWRAAARVDQALADVLPAGVDVHGYGVLVALADGAARSQQWLADTIGVSRTTMTKVAADLAARALVERVRNPDDRRSYALSVTPTGAEASADWGQHVAAVEAELLAGFTAGERAELHGLLLAVAAPILAPGLLPELTASSGFLITRLHAHTHTEVMAALQDLDLEPRHLGTLTVLTTVGPVAQAQLARHLGVSSPTVVEIADHLERRGLIQRRRLATDRRTQVLHLLPGAAAVAAEAKRRGMATTRVVLQPLANAEIDRLMVLLARLITGRSGG